MISKKYIAVDLTDSLMAENMLLQNPDNGDDNLHSYVLIETFSILIIIKKHLLFNL